MKHIHQIFIPYTRIKTLFITLSIISILVLSSNYQAQQLNMELLEGLKARSIGPAGMSGRVTSIDVVLNNPETIYVGTASGGLWRSTSGGTKWEPIFDDQPVASIGAVAIDQNVPDIIWVGTGEGNPRNSQTSGNGVYKSIDGGKKWTHLGLENTRNIHRVIIDPTNSDVVYVGAQGSAWGESSNKGIYKTTNGGEAWEKILYVDEKTGVADLVMDPSNPNKLIAAMWEFRRWPWFFNSGGPGSGLHVTFDGGKTWKKRTEKDGLPKGEFGRIGLAVSHGSPNIIYALIESKKNALYKSTDGGFKWKKIADKNIGNRPFYYAEIYVDPKNENRIYNLYSIVTVSEDGGKTFSDFLSWGKIHPDHQAWWIHPNDPDFIIDGNDGGLAITRDRGKSWRFVENLPLAQFYHINVDMDSPYNVYGGMQDNGSWRGPSSILRRGGIRNAYWESIGGGDGFDVVPVPGDSRFGYAMSQGGSLFRYDVLTGDRRSIRPYHPDGEKLRFNWNAGIAQDPSDNNTFYYGSQYLHKSTDRGNSWTIISPDLTTNNPEKQKQIESGGLTYDVTNAENYTSIISIAPSSLKEGVIWVGTDDGNVQLTKDGGKSWNNLAANIDNIPQGCWITQIRASTYNFAEAFVVINNYRMNDWTPYVFRTKDYGETWERIVSDDDVFGYALSIVQDPVEPKLHFLGTEFGLYLSIDAGKNWTKWKHGFPTVSTMDLVIQPIESDLVIGTFGRAAYIIDNIQPLRELAKDGEALFDNALKIFNIPDATLVFRKSGIGGWSLADAGFEGKNESYGAMITYSISPDSMKTKSNKKEMNENKAKNEDSVNVKIEILDSNNKLIRTLERKSIAGINRIFWYLDRKGIRFPNTPKPKPGASERGGPNVLPGIYKIRMSYGDYKESANVIVKFDDRVKVDESNLLTRDDMLNEFIKNVKTATDAVDRLNEINETDSLILKQIMEKEDSLSKDLKKLGKAITDTVKTLIELINQEEVQGIRRDNTKVVSRLSTAYYSILSSYDAPGERERINIKLAEESLRDALVQINGFIETEWKEYIEKVKEADISFFKEYEKLKVEE
jgi:photosystem II stability/assembly factor-like uncharacterized protein